ncbi:ARM repeat superfamily protein isoform 4 [Hibiscus syriacus]|uniref:ARM repeat superfamily protein isoform 4 n=1 Tax=Hibiscus syriacus TaxID=106335 RepID=A0A6A2WS27_HIBSY|nr:ARM repeat superfamily protein isoform 4 [Hibiscus syriacus]
MRRQQLKAEGPRPRSTELKAHPDVMMPRTEMMAPRRKNLEDLVVREKLELLSLTRELLWLWILSVGKGLSMRERQQQPDGLVAGSLDLLTMLLKASVCDSIVQNAPTDVVKAAYDACFDAIIRIILESDDHSEMQNATECLASFVSGGRKELLAWGSDSGFTMRSLLDAASRLLDPDLESSGSLFVGSYILQLILHLPSQMGQHIQNLIVALVRRMQSASIAGLRSSLLLIFARLIHLSVPNVEQFINLLLTIPAEGYQNAFVYVMSEWTKQQGKFLFTFPRLARIREIQGAYQIKVTTSALALLLSTKHPELTNINVQGHLIKSMSGITTRSKAKSAPDQWTIMPLPAKILALLADALIEIQEQAQDAEDENSNPDSDSDWEEIHGDMDADKDLLSSAAAAAPFGKSGYEHLEVMAKVYNENQEDDYEDDTLNVADPLNEINLANYLTDFLSKFYQSDRQLFDNLCQVLASWLHPLICFISFRTMTSKNVNSFSMTLVESDTRRTRCDQDCFKPMRYLSSSTLSLVSIEYRN